MNFTSLVYHTDVRRCNENYTFNSCIARYWDNNGHNLWVADWLSDWF